jgi:hypothetical protein
MDATELRDLFRIEMSDAIVPYLLSDPQVYVYLDDAQKQFCRWTEGIEDGRSFTLSIQPNAEWYDTDASILKLRKVTDAVTGRPVTLINTETVEDRGIRFDGRTGPLSVLVMGIEKHAVRAWPMPSLPATLALEVFRLPRTIEAGDELEVDEQHHINLLMWAKHRAYGNEDSEIFHAARSEKFKQDFREYCADARKEQERARRVTGAVSYGGI